MSNESFSDYYEDLQVSPNADQETIERIFRLLAKRYHTDNNLTGNVEKFDIITKAYKVLSSPEKRAAYDVDYENKRDQLWKSLFDHSPDSGYENDKHIRKSILSVLYVERRQNVSHSGIGMWHLEKILKWPEQVLEFHIWYLKEKGWIERTDTGGYAITANGIDEIENDGLILRRDRLLSEKTEAYDVMNASNLIEKSVQL
jgi:curved DNA-binding protein CbpA